MKKEEIVKTLLNQYAYWNKRSKILKQDLKELKNFYSSLMC